MNEDNYRGPEIFVQAVFVISSIVMLIGLPFFADYLNLPTFAAILGILVLGIFAGMTTKRNRWAMIVNIIISVVGCFAFEYIAVQSRDLTAYFIFNQVVAFLFLVGIIASIKAFRKLYWISR